MRRAVCILLVKDGKFLSATRRNDIKWGLPGGKVDDGETELEAIIRETREETGLELDPVKLCALYSAWCPPDNADGHYYWTTTYFVNADASCEKAMTVEPGIEIQWRKMSEFGTDTDLFKKYNAQVMVNYYLLRNSAFTA